MTKKILTLAITSVLLLVMPLVGCVAEDPILDDIYIEGDLNVWDGGGWVNVNTSLGGGGSPYTATYVVAANDSPAHIKDTADYVCDGVADDVEIQAALTAAGASSILLMDGNYACAANLTIPAGGALVGSSWNTVVTFSGAAITQAVTLNGDNCGVYNIKLVMAAGVGTGGARPNIIYAASRAKPIVSKVWLVGDSTVADDGSDDRQNGIYFTSCNYGWIQNNLLETNKRMGIYLYYSNHLIITGNRILTSTSYDIYGRLVNYSQIGNNEIYRTINGTSIYLRDNSANYNQITGNFLRGNSTASGIGIYLYGVANYTAISSNTIYLYQYGVMISTSVERIAVTGNAIASCSYGVYIAYGTQNTVTGNTFSSCSNGAVYINYSSNNTVSGNEAKSCKYLVYLNDSSGNTITGNTIHYMINTGAVGIYLTGSHYNTISGNNISHVYTYGIYLTGSNSNNINGNVINGVSKTSANTYDTIYLTSSDYNTISSNTLRDTSARYGLNIADDNCDRNMVEGNDFYACATTGAVNDASVTNPTLYRDNRDLAGTGWLPDV